MSYLRPTHVLPMSYSYPTHVLHMSHTCPTHVLLMKLQAPSSKHTFYPCPRSGMQLAENTALLPRCNDILGLKIKEIGYRYPKPIFSCVWKRLMQTNHISNSCYRRFAVKLHRTVAAHFERDVLELVFLYENLPQTYTFSNFAACSF